MTSVETMSAACRGWILFGAAAAAALFLEPAPSKARTIDDVCVRIELPMPNQTVQVGLVQLKVWNTTRCPIADAGNKIEVQIERPQSLNSPDTTAMNATFHVYKAGIGKTMTALNSYIGGVPAIYRVRARKVDTPGWGSYTPWVVFKVVLKPRFTKELYPVPKPIPGPPPVRKPGAPSQ